MLVGDMIGLWINSSSAYPLHRIRRQEVRMLHMLQGD